VRAIFTLSVLALERGNPTMKTGLLRSRPGHFVGAPLEHSSCFLYSPALFNMGRYNAGSGCIGAGYPVRGKANLCNGSDMPVV